MGHSWVGELANYRFTIKYQPGKSNSAAHTLSRLALGVEDYVPTCIEGFSLDAVQAVLTDSKLQKDGIPPCILATNLEAWFEVYETGDEPRVHTTVDKIEMQEAESKDQVIQ